MKKQREEKIGIVPFWSVTVWDCKECGDTFSILTNIRRMEDSILNWSTWDSDKGEPYCPSCGERN